MKRDADIFWQDRDGAFSWAEAVALHLEFVLGPIFGGGLTVELKLPEAETAKKAVADNLDLTGEAVLRWSVISEKLLRLQIPLPYHGAFVKRREDSGTPGLAVWASWLGELPGFRYLRKPGDDEVVFWRVGLPGGGYVQARCRDLSDEQRKRAFSPRLRILPPRTLWPQFLHGAYDLKGPADIPDKGGADKRGGFWGLVHDLATKNKCSGDVAITDEDDLNHRVLVTFPVWLKARLAEAMLATILEIAGGDLAEAIRALAEKVPVDTELAKRLWERLVETDRADALALRLRPPGWSPVPAVKGQRRFYPLQWVDPVNPVDLAALLTEVRRYPLAHEILENLPAHYRQNHPSFQGRICPVQSPESELVGLSLHLARGAKVDWDGRITPADGSKPHEELGFGAGLVPFYEHNDGARCMMGARNLRQAVPVTKRRSPLVKTGGELAVQEFVKPLVDAGICPDASDGEGALALGVDLLVAYLPWKGMNVDDAIVVGEHVVEQGLLDFEISKRFRSPLKSGWVHTGFGPASVFRRVNERWEIEGVTLHGGDPIATVGLEGAEERVKKKLIYRDRSPAKLTSIGFHRGAEWMRGELEYELVKHLKLGLGDKLMGRHGNKGVVGAILPSDQMPRLPNNDKLLPHLRGKPIDILLNPHGVISRMNLGQLLETHIGWLLHFGYRQEQFLKPGIPSDASVGRAFSGALDHAKVQHLLGESGLDRFGRIQLILPDGSQTASPVVVGYQHIVRLKHVPELKAQARRGGQGAVYSRSTGQAIHGRLLGGGQRAGEMEVWALAGHQAEHILEEMLGVKADSFLTHRLENARPTDSKDVFQGFSQRLKDWLFALLIDLRLERNKVGFAFLDAASARTRIGADKKVSNSESLRRMVLASFSCQPKKKEGCSFQLLDGQRIAAEPPKGKSPNEQVSLKLEELLDHLGLALAGPLKQKRGKYFLELRTPRDGHPTGNLKVSFNSSKTQVKATIHADEGQPPLGWPNALNGLPLCGQFQHEKGRNAEATLVLEEFLKEDGRWQFGKLAVACPKQHSTTPLKGKPPFDERLDVDPGSLFDKNLFGTISSAGTTDDAKHWAYIELPVGVPYPVESFLGPEEDVGDFMRKHSIRSESLPSINVVPVLPLRYRMPLLLADSTQQDQLVTDGYIPIINACRQYEAADDDQKRAGAVAQLRRSVKVLFRLLASHLTGKQGLIRHAGLGRRVDMSARLVIVPNPQLHWDEAGVPTSVLLEFFGQELKRWIKERRESGDLAEIISVMTANKDDADMLADWSWRKSAKDQSLLQEGYKLLCQFLDAHPDILVVFNRQPSLHRDSIQAFRPVPLPPHVGEVLQLCPLVCKGFGADFDGDEMSIHVPISQAARQESKRMLPSQNIFSLAVGEILPEKTEQEKNRIYSRVELGLSTKRRSLLAQFEQDFVLGMYWLSRDDSGFKPRLLSALPGDCCRKWVSKTVLNQDAGTDLLEHLASAHPKEATEIIWKLSNLAYDCCSRMGVSFGFYELAEFSTNCRNKSREVLKGFDHSKPDKINGQLNKVVQKPLMDLLHGGTSLFDRAGLHFAAMALSGARGKQQVRQLVAARGFLSPGMPAANDQFLVGSSLVQGMTAEEAFFAAMNSRSSMCDKKLGTRNAGYLTRRLVTALWPTRVVEEDCGDPEETRNPATCRTRNGICAACYGALLNGPLPQIGFPAGLIAAQSIGERGTQLSMQSFHTGEKAFTIQSVLDILDGKGGERFFNHPEDAAQFLAAMMKSQEGEKKKPYNDLDEHHFLLLWRVIHNSPAKSLKSATQSGGLFTLIGFEQQGKNILLAACGNKRASLNEPFARVFFNQFGTRCQHMEAKS